MIFITETTTRSVPRPKVRSPREQSAPEELVPFMDDWQIVAAIAKARKGITQYLAIRDTLHRVDVSRDRNFQKRYNSFFKVRQRSPKWYERHYAYLTCRLSSDQSLLENSAG